MMVSPVGAPGDVPVLLARVIKASVVFNKESPIGSAAFSMIGI
jgi:hypothetical protein